MQRNCDDVDGVNVDGDGYADAMSGGDDCDDSNPNIHPAAADDSADGVDQNCDGFDGVDADGDLYAASVSGGDDCDDTDASVNPGGTEISNDGIDNDCDGYDDTSMDNDADGFGSALDCDDSNPGIHPGAREIPNDDIDQNCDGVDANYVGVGRYLFQDSLPPNEYHCDLYFNLVGVNSEIPCSNCDYVFDLTITYDSEPSIFQSYGTRIIAPKCLERMMETHVTYGYTSNFEVDSATADYYDIGELQNAVLLYEPSGAMSNADGFARLCW